MTDKIKFPPLFFVNGPTLRYFVDLRQVYSLPPRDFFKYLRISDALRHHPPLNTYCIYQQNFSDSIKIPSKLKKESHYYSPFLWIQILLLKSPP